MSSVDYIKEGHEEISKNLSEFESIISEKEKNLDYWNLIHVFHNLTDQIFEREQKKQFIVEKSKDFQIRTPINKMLLDQRKVKGHIKVINEALLSKDINFIRVALDTDGRMVSTNIKHQMLKEEQILDRLVFLRMGS